MAHYTPKNKILTDTISQTPWDREFCFDTKFVTTWTKALAVTSILNREGPKHPYLSGNHAYNSYDKRNVEDSQYYGNMVMSPMKSIMGNNVPQHLSASENRLQNLYYMTKTNKLSENWDKAPSRPKTIKW